MADHSPHQVVGTTFEQGNLGSLEDAIYETLRIRVRINEYFEPSEEKRQKRVVVFEIPSRPVGKMLKFEGVPLMRTGESLREMSDEEMFRVLSEQEPDSSAMICEGLTVDDLDSNAIAKMKQKYAEKQKNPLFRNMPTQQVLTDLELLVDGKLNYAALMLLGKQETIHKILPQYSIVIEYRKNKAMIPFTARKEFQQPLFLSIDGLWEFINQPLSNPEDHLRVGPYIYDVLAFNEDSVREAILNALAHRSIQIQSDVVVKQSPEELTILNPGGFPIGVDKNNILTVSSTPRSKRLAEVLQKTGLVERSGQGVDKMFANSIMDGKLLPSFEGTDYYQVQLTFDAKLRYPNLARLVRIHQEERGEDRPLTVFELLELYHINRGEYGKVPDDEIKRLSEDGLIERNNGVWQLAGGNDPLNDPLNPNDVLDVRYNKRQSKIVELVCKNFNISREELSLKLNVSVATIRRDMKILGYSWEGHSTNGHWVKK